MKKHENFFEKMFGSFSVGSSRVPLRSNIFNSGSGYSKIGSTGGGMFGNQRQSPLLGNASPSNLMSGYYERTDELKSYQLLDVVKLATNFFADYIINFLGEGRNAVTIMDENNETADELKTEKLNEILINDLKIYDYIRSHVKDVVFHGSYTSMLLNTKDELGHLKFRFEEINDPVSVVLKKKKNRAGDTEDSYITRGSGNKLYEIPSENAFMLGSINLRLENDLDDSWERKNQIVKPSFGKTSGKENIEKVLRTCSYLAGEPLFYSSILKVKELVIKELLVSLISLRDISSIQIFLLQFDKQTPLETANEICARTTKLANNTNELASFLTSQFDAVSFLENTLSQSAKFVPDYNSTIGNKNSMLPLDKLSDKLLDLMQNLDNCRNNVLSPLGIPATILDSTSGSKWQILQQSERANSRVTGFMTGIKESVTRLVAKIYETIYHEDIDPSRIQLHISEKTSVEYNNQINQSESVGVNGITGIVTNALQTLDGAMPFIDVKAYLSYIQGLIKDIDPNTEPLITEETINKYTAFAQAKLSSMLEQQGLDPSILETPTEEENV